MLSRAMQGWQERAAVLAVRRQREREADAQARDWCLLRALSRWRGAVDELKCGRGLKAQRLHGLRNHMGRAKAGRVLFAWLERHHKAMMKSLQVGGNWCVCVNAMGGSTPFNFV